MGQIGFTEILSLPRWLIFGALGTRQSTILWQWTKTAIWHFMTKTLHSAQIFVFEDSIKSIDLNSCQHITVNSQNNDIFVRLTLTRPIGLPPHAPLRRKVRISADLSLIWQKIGTFYIKWCNQRLVSVNNHRFFSSISFVRISYKTIWLKTWSWYKNHWKMKSGRA